MIKRVAITMILFAMTAAAACAASNQAAKDNPKKSDASTAKQPEHFIIKLMPSYFEIRKSLGANTIKSVSDNAAAFAKTLKSQTDVLGKQKKQSEELAPLNNILKAAQPLTEKQTDIEKTRVVFGKLSDALVDYMNKYVGLYYTRDFKIYYCNMSKHYWVQKAGEKMINPYLGKEMPNCGEDVGGGDQQPTGDVPGRDTVLKCEPRRR
jgi:hypothetical protein